MTNSYSKIKLRQDLDAFSIIIIEPSYHKRFKRYNKYIKTYSWYIYSYSYATKDYKKILKSSKNTRIILFLITFLLLLPNEIYVKGGLDCEKWNKIDNFITKIINKGIKEK